jgi:hypothetical protein
MLPLASVGAPDMSSKPPDLSSSRPDLSSSPRMSSSPELSSSPAPLLTVKKVFEVFPRVNKINTPEVNLRLAIPFKKPQVVSRVEFKESYSEVKNSLRKISWKSGNPLEEKERRHSLPFNWPASAEGIIQYSGF